MNSINEALIEFNKNKYEYYTNEYSRLDKLSLEFKNKFPKDKIINMNIDDYVVGKGSENESFCYWLETKLRELGSINGGTSEKFGIYYSKKDKKYKTLKKWDRNLDIIKAFNKIKNSINVLITAGEAHDLNAIASSPLSPMFKSKILTTYYPNKYLNIFSPEHVDYFCNKLNINVNENMSFEEKRNLLIEYKNDSVIMKKYSNYIFMVFLYWWSNPKVSQIRLLPMSAKYEFPNKTIKDIQQQFFLGELIKNKGKYYYRSTGFNTSKGTLVLFQIKNRVIASAYLDKIERYKKPLEGIYKGSYIFKPTSIKTFDPITAQEISKIDSTFKRFSQVKHTLDNSKQDEFINLINSKVRVIYPDELSSDTTMYTEGVKHKICVNAYERNKKARQECIKYKGYKCAICGFDFGEVYGGQFEGKIHVHHIKPINEIDDEYTVDPQKDLIPVCPNCHMILHSKANGTYTVEDVREFIRENNKNNIL